MSFVKYPVKPRVISTKTGSSGRHGDKKRTKKKPDWDPTVNDLTVYKASPDELRRRKAVAQSNNMDLVKDDLIRKQISKAQKKSKSPGYAKSKKSSAFLREVLHDESQLADVIASSDKVMAVVKDLFGDYPGKYHGLPNVTTAPEGTVLPHEKLPNGASLSNRSRLDVLSESLMDKTALNDLEDQYNSDDDDDDGDDSEPLSYQPAMDLTRFQQLLQRAEGEESKQRGKSQLTHSMAERALQKTLNKITKTQDDDWLNRDSQSVPDSPLPNSQPNLAINDTGKVQRTKSCTEQSQSLPAPVNVTADNLKQVLDHLEMSLCDYEQQTGRQPTFPTAAKQSQNTFSSYTTALVTSVTKLTQYFKESELRLRAESTLRELLSQDVEHLKGVIDSLTTDIIQMQEEFNKLHLDHVHHRQSSDQQISTLRQTLTANGIDVPPVLPVPRPAFEVAAPQFNRPRAESLSEITVGLPRPVLPASDQGFQAAMLLSPPIQTDSPRSEGKRPSIRPEVVQNDVGTTQPQSNLPFCPIKSLPRASLQQNMQQLVQKQLQQQDQQSYSQHQLLQQQQLTSRQPHQQQYQQQQSSYQQQQPSYQQQQPSYQQQQPYQQQQDLQKPKQAFQMQRNDQQHIMNQQPNENDLTQKLFQLQHHLQQIMQTSGNAATSIATSAPTSIVTSATTSQSMPQSAPQPQVNPAFRASTASAVLDDDEREMLELQKQLDELNRQHLEAQSKLQYIYEYQKLPNGDPGMTNTAQKAPGHQELAYNQLLEVIRNTQTAGSGGQPPHTSVAPVNNMTDGRVTPTQVVSMRFTMSPPISPISALSGRTERSIQSNIGLQPVNQMIRVSLPSANSPVTEQQYSGLRMVNGAASKTKPLGAPNAAWFALSSHVGVS